MASIVVVLPVLLGKPFKRNAVWGGGGRIWLTPSPVILRGQTLELSAIEESVREFMTYAKANPTLTFYVVRVGCGVAGYADAQMAPLFSESGPNCIFSEKWKPWLE